MKPTRLTRSACMALHALVVAMFVLAFGAVGLAAAFINPNVYGPLLGASYDKINTTSAAELVALTPKAREELWARRILQGSEALYQSNPFADNFTGRSSAGAAPNPSALRKAVVMITDTEKVRGNTINVPTFAGLGGPGAYGEETRVGKEQKLVTGNFPVQIGRLWFGVGYKATARDETVIGSNVDRMISDGLRALTAKKKSDDHIMRMIQASKDATYGIANNLLPTGVSATAELLSADTVSTTLISSGGEILPGLGAMPMDTTTDSGGSVGELYMFFSTDKALVDLAQDPVYINGLQNAGERGDNNPIFKGGFKNWNGHGIYKWINRDHANRGPIGSPLLARARLGAVDTSGTVVSSGAMAVTTGCKLHGGGHVWVANDSPAPLYFEFFENAPYQFISGDSIAAVTTTKHLMIINSNGTFGVFPYQVNDGKTITISGSALAVGPSGKRVTSFEKGAKIVQTNILGTVIGRSLYLGAASVVCGAGSINGSKADPQMGVRTEEKRDHGLDIGIGIEGAWGNAAVRRAGDQFYPNFLVATHAISEDKAPVIT